MNGPRSFDAIVIGVGGMGSAALYHLARRGKSVLGLERFDIPNEIGSSHGVTRIFRLSYHNSPGYVPLVRRAYELWRELERETGEKLLWTTGSIEAGPPGSPVFEGARRSYEEHGLRHLVLDSAELTRRFPAYRLPADTMAVLQPDGGFLTPERCVETHAEAARKAGAEIHSHERVLDWQPTANGVSVETDRGTYQGEKLVIAAGAWSSSMVNCMDALAVPERQVLAWLEPSDPELFTPARFPVFTALVPEGSYYGTPIFGVPGFKLGRFHHRGEVTEAETLDRNCYPEDEAVLRSFAAKYFPTGAGKTLAFRVCMFVNSPDGDFIIDTLRDMPQVAVAAGFSGRGFKFCSVVGEILADLTCTGSTAHEIDFLRLHRFSKEVPFERLSNVP